MHRDHRSGGGGKPLFSEKDWDCGSCFNKNWARRQSCNVCNAPKPSLDLGSRNGSGGGFKERDDVIEYKETRYHSDDELDDFGRKKKKKSRASNQGSILSSTGTEGSAKGDEGKGDEDEDDDRWDAWADVLGEDARTLLKPKDNERQRDESRDEKRHDGRQEKTSNSWDREGEYRRDFPREGDRRKNTLLRDRSRERIYSTSSKDDRDRGERVRYRRDDAESVHAERRREGRHDGRSDRSRSPYRGTNYR